MADNYSVKGDAFLQHFTNLQPIEQTVSLWLYLSELPQYCRKQGCQILFIQALSQHIQHVFPADIWEVSPANPL